MEEVPIEGVNQGYSPYFKEVSLKNPLQVLSNKFSNNSYFSPIASIRHQNVIIYNNKEKREESKSRTLYCKCEF